MNDTSELLIEIAKVKKLVRPSWWSIHPDDDIRGRYYMRCISYGEVMLMDNKGDMPMLAYQEHGGLRAIPSWTTDIAAAWDLVKEMTAAGVLVHLSFDRLWYFHYAGAGDLFSAETAPEVICRAYLAWRKACTPS